jgi:hypothetical protein
LVATGFGNGFAILDQPLDVESQSLGRHIARFVQSASGGNDSGKIGKRNAVVAVGVFVDQGDILFHQIYSARCSARWQLSEFQSRLLLDAFERSEPDQVYKYTPIGAIALLSMGHRRTRRQSNARRRGSRHLPVPA